VPTKEGALKASINNSNSEVSLESGVVTKDTTDLRENVSSDKNSNINKSSNLNCMTLSVTNAHSV
jgi:hypothetical protein